MMSILGMSFSMPPQPFFSAGSLGPLSSFQSYGLLSYGLSTPPSTYGRYASSMDGLSDLTMPPSSFGLTSFGDPIAPSFGGLYAGGAFTSTLAQPMAAFGSAYQFSHLITMSLAKTTFCCGVNRFSRFSAARDSLVLSTAPIYVRRRKSLSLWKGGAWCLSRTQNITHGLSGTKPFSAIVGSLTPSVSGLVLLATSSLDAWATLNTSFSSQSNARAMQICKKVGQMKKHNLSVHNFFNQVKTAADTLASIGQPLRATEFACFVLNGLDQEYDGLVEVVEGRKVPISERDLYARLMSMEQRIEARRATNVYTESMANAAARGRGCPQHDTGNGGYRQQQSQQP
jgi:hypothetical protein